MFDYSGWSDLEEVSLVINWLEYTFTKHGGKCMSVKGQGDDEVGMKKISQVALKMTPLFDIKMEEADRSKGFRNVNKMHCANLSIDTIAALRVIFYSFRSNCK